MKDQKDINEFNKNIFNNLERIISNNGKYYVYNTEANIIKS